MPNRPESIIFRSGLALRNTSELPHFVGRIKAGRGKGVGTQAHGIVYRKHVGPADLLCQADGPTRAARRAGAAVLRSIEFFYGKALTSGRVLAKQDVASTGFPVEAIPWTAGKGQVEPVLLRRKRFGCHHGSSPPRALTFAGVTKCRTMSSRSSPRTDPTEAERPE